MPSSFSGIQYMHFDPSNLPEPLPSVWTTVEQTPPTSGQRVQEVFESSSSSAISPSPLSEPRYNIDVATSTDELAVSAVQGAIPDIGEHIFVWIWGQIQTLPETHAMLGPPVAGQIKMPKTSTRANGCCWEQCARRIGRAVRDTMGAQVPAGSCWMTTKSSIMRYQISMNGIAYRSFNTVRLIAFLADSSDSNWRNFKADSSQVGSRAIDHPFNHRCHRGPAYNNQDNGTMRCINGLEHGHFATKEENESAKVCGLVSARVLCPGHGENTTKCFFTHENGHPKPCLNMEEWVPRCECQPKCY
ncbi:hypothetical protein EDD36DRAFT_417998 [Exophiala viscosa]|uniref:Uncharacterized protein n=1 Tax=Exophiala viscosa TaxID=2486360 RepID=A0AAN6IE53_9EURO|nr:hypothetical protein EDD36DRAFT_417998 [Exophiala viscosa]